MPSSSGRSGRAKARRAPDRAQPPSSTNTPNSDGTDDAAPAVPGPAGGSKSGGRSQRRRGRRSRVRHRRAAQQPKQGANPPAAGRVRGAQPGAQRSAGRAAQRSSRRRGGAQQAAGQVRRPRRMRTVRETSAGGLVVDFSTSRAALIGRLDRRGKLLWSLPKGHIEAGETAEQAAVREVAEETGIDSAVLTTLGSIEYWFVADDRRVHKTVHHYLLRAVGGQLSDQDLEVTEVAWVALPDLQARLAYADERRLVRRATDLLAESA